MLVFLLQTNTYQGILITDGYQSFAVFTYQCGLLQWHGGASIGFNGDEGKFYQNYHAADIDDVACSNSPTSPWSNIIYQLCKYVHISSSYQEGNDP